MWFHGYPPTVEVARRILLGANTKNSRRLWWLAMWGNNSSDIHVFSGISTQDLSFERLQCRKKQKMAVWGSAKLAQKNHHLVSWASKTAGPPLIHWGIPRPRRSQALAGAQCWAAHDEIRLELCIFHVLDSVEPDGAVLLPRPWRNCHKKTWNIGNLYDISRYIPFI